MELIVDVALAVAAVLSIASGWRRGAVLSAVPMVGLIGGLWLGLQFAPTVVGWLAGIGWGNVVQRTIVASVFILVCASVIYGAAATLATMIRRRLSRGPVRGIDAVGGAAVGLVTWALVVWLVAGFLQTTTLIPVTQVVASSKIVAALDAISPVPASTALGALDDALRQAGLPKVFEHGESIASAAPPDPSIPAAVSAAASGVVRVLANEPACGTASEGSGWVLAGDRVVTNAHVVAGASSVAVQARGVGSALPAQLVAFDPERDVAVLEVPGLNVAPLKLGAPLPAGASAVAAGFPGDGPYTMSPARVRQTLDATGTDIYRSRTVTREIYSLRGVVRPGNSGGPLFDTNGHVVGVVFARSTTDGDTGYALTLAEVQPVLAQAGSSTPVSSGRCTSG
ncbi:MAG: MarP family serine protease [Microbacteriaceae bacterium]|nr:MAG: MarP family serine protease [Microbacteriaceae bacterium]